MVPGFPWLVTPMRTEIDVVQASILNGQAKCQYLFYNVFPLQKLLSWLGTSMHNLLSAFAEKGRKKKNIYIIDIWTIPFIILFYLEKN